MTKDKVLETIEELPKQFDLDELIERLIFIDKIEKGLEKLNGGKVKTQEEVKRIIKTWHK